MTTEQQNTKQLYVILIFFFIVTLQGLEANIRLPKLISDGMILQRNTNVAIWGYSDTNTLISITFLNSTKTVTTGDKGIWIANFNTQNDPGPYQISITSKDEQIIIKDILLGDVYLCSGQSNMELPMRRVAPLYQDEIQNANYPNIRYFEVPKEYEFSAPRDTLSGGQWLKVDENSIDEIAAVSYFFSKEIHQDQNVPVGIINSSLGGSPIESWLSLDDLAPYPSAFKEAKNYQNQEFRDSIIQSDQNRIQNWYADLNQKDLGIKQNWKLGNIDSTQWNTINIPDYWSNTSLGNKNGVVWFHKRFKLDNNHKGQKATLNLGRIVDADSVFVNGRFIGNTTYQYPPRIYTIPEDVLESTNTIIIKVINERGQGGFVDDKQYNLQFADGNEVDLVGAWRYKLGAELHPLRPQTFIRWKASGLYNAMIHPLIRYRFSGVLWYQGESNVDNADEYDTLIKTLIAKWREDWNDDNLPFFVVQLANYLQSYDEPTESDWAVMREAQQSVLDLDHTAIAVTIDIGEWNDIHPLNKKDVGHRLALAAKNIVYKEDVIYQSPRIDSVIVEKDQIQVHFNTFGSNLVIQGEHPRGFAIAGKDRKFYWAKAELVKDCVILKSPKVIHPQFIRYAWADNPDTANIFNEEGLPAAPFRNDSD
ncbi:sialate O-acetylesterase [Leeuwenhoekiella sp. UBA6783]|uniref:sialate O-acetylesterase n=1 Tax=Leeuwenhoekiella sp. UBA6783 TaxID=1946747 RepID=UPI0025C07A3D|nr:sialate O-acetylesterase [Leeuwenhoekiella sp. UBA6783]|tara:strand:+ start:33490 stop:35436 length:1947 start_codon:yes stop_codon:yes gene_type:complete